MSDEFYLLCQHVTLLKEKQDRLIEVLTVLEELDVDTAAVQDELDKISGSFEVVWADMLEALNG